MVKAASCRVDSFGLTGKYTTAVCDAVDAVQVACAAEPGCDIAKVPNVVSASSEQFLIGISSPDEDAIKGLMKTSVCVYRVVSGYGAPFNGISDCLDPDALPDDSDLAARVENYHLIMFYVLPQERQNPLWTNTAAITSKFIDPNACFVLGDGYLQLAEETWDAFEAPLTTPRVTERRDLTYAKSVVVDTLVHQYTDDEISAPTKMFTDPDEDEFYRDVLHGYFYQRYSSTLFPNKWEKRMLTDGTMLRSPTICAIPMGSLMSYRCGVDADDIHTYMTYFYANGVGSQDTYSGDEMCAAATTEQECFMVGGSGLNKKCCSWSGSSCAATPGTGSDVCATKFCVNFDRGDLWNGKRGITRSFSPPATKLSPEDCFSLLDLV